MTDADARVGARLQTATAGEGKIQFTDYTTDYDPNQGGGNFERKFWNDVITDAIAGAAVGALVDGIGAVPGALGGAGIAMGGALGLPEGGVGVIPGMIIGGAGGGIEAFLEGATDSEPPKCGK